MSFPPACLRMDKEICTLHYHMDMGQRHTNKMFYVQHLYQVLCCDVKYNTNRMLPSSDAYEKCFKFAWLLKSWLVGRLLLSFSGDDGGEPLARYLLNQKNSFLKTPRGLSGLFPLYHRSPLCFWLLKTYN